MPFRGQNGSDTSHMYIRILTAAAMTDVHTELEHLEPVRQDGFTELGIVLSIPLGFGGHVKKYQNPHDAIGIKT